MNALILVDLQNDFLPGGALAVPQGDQVIPVANDACRKFDLVVATKDWHPADHGSFASQHAGKSVGDVIELAGQAQILWPDHCVQDTPGADFAPALNADAVDKVFHKGTDPAIDSYSGFFDGCPTSFEPQASACADTPRGLKPRGSHCRGRRRKATGLGDYLKEKGVTGVYIMGLATDYCVKFTALDARQLGFDTRLILEGVRGIELNPGDCAKALAVMTAAGVETIRMDRVPQIR